MMKQITVLLGIIFLSAGFAFSDELDIRLTGTIIEKDKAFAFIEDNTTGEQGIYRSGDRLKEYRIIKIIKDQVTLSGNNREIVLFIEGTDSPINPNNPNNPVISISPYQRGTRKVDEDSYELSANRFADMLNNVSSNKDKIRLYQHHESGKKAGFRIHYLKGGNDFKNMGIKNGDIFRKINDLVINDASDIRKAIYKFRTENNFKIEIKRKSEKKILSYRLDERLYYLVPAVSNLLNIPEDSAAY